MKWISNGDPPLYVWMGDVWYDQKTKHQYIADIIHQRWWCMNYDEFKYIEFPKKTKVMK